MLYLMRQGRTDRFASDTGCLWGKCVRSLWSISLAKTFSPLGLLSSGAQTQRCLYCRIGQYPNSHSLSHPFSLSFTHRFVLFIMDAFTSQPFFPLAQPLSCHHLVSVSWSLLFTSHQNSSLKTWSPNTHVTSSLWEENKEEVAMYAKPLRRPLCSILEYQLISCRLT